MMTWYVAVSTSNNTFPGAGLLRHQIFKVVCMEVINGKEF